LAKLNEVIFNELLAETGSQQPWQQMFEIPTIEGELLNYRSARTLAINGWRRIRSSRSYPARLQLTLRAPRIHARHFCRQRKDSEVCSCGRDNISA
jgi:hypothetical protein